MPDSKFLYFYKKNAGRFDTVYMSDKMPTLDQDGRFCPDKSQQAMEKQVPRDWLKFFGVTWVPGHKVVRVQLQLQDVRAAEVTREVKVGGFFGLEDPPPESDPDEDEDDDFDDDEK